MKRAVLCLSSLSVSAALLSLFSVQGCLSDASPEDEAGAAPQQNTGGGSDASTLTDEDAGSDATILPTGDDDDSGMTVMTGDTGTGDDAQTDGSVNGGDGGAAAVAIVRVGDGVTALSSTTTITAATFVDLYSEDGSFVRSVALPAALGGDAGATHLLTLSSSVTEGYPGLSVDKSALYLAAHDVPPGANLATDAGSVALARIDVNGLSVQAPVTGLGDPSNVRSVASVDGGPLWISDHSGVYAVNAARAATRVSDLGGAIPREVAIFQSQLFVSSASNSFTGVGSFDGGLPTATASVALLPGPVNSASYQYVMFDSNADDVLDLLYIAAGDGVEKWTFSTTTSKWTKTATTALAVGDAAAAGASGLTGRIDGTAVTLYATTDTSSDNAAYKLVDTTSGTVAATVTSFATPPARSGFRGIAFVPGS